MLMHPKKLLSGSMILALSMVPGGMFFAGLAHAQASASQHEVIAGDFHQDVQQGKDDIKDEPDAQNNQQEIDNEDEEQAGDDHSDHNNVIEGEKPENDIEQEINVEAQSGEQGQSESAPSGQ